VCAWQARRARRGPRPYEEALPGSGLVGGGLLRGEQRPVRITWLGDSLAAGLGCDHVDDTPAHLAARLLERAVDVTVLAVPGSRAVHVIEDQLPGLDRASDLVVVCVGANDVASPTTRRQYRADLDAILTELAPLPTIVLSLPDLTMPDRVAEPLRTLAGLRARWFEAGRARVVARHPHARSVDIASRPDGVSRKVGREMLCSDRFHPGPQGYRVWAERIATVCDQILEPAVAPTLTD
jgi:lysophospholipase L1-like esterase